MIHSMLFASLLLQAKPDTLTLGLRQAMDAARKDAYQAEAARSRSRELRGKAEESRSALLPHVGASATDLLRSFDLPAMGLSFPATEGSPQFPNLIGPYNSQDARINGRIALFDAPAWKHWRAARLEAEKGRLEAAAAEDGVAAAAAEAYYALSRARSLVVSRKSELSLASRLASLTAAQLDAGTATRIEVLRADGQVSASRSALAAAEGAEEQARYVLLRILGLDLGVMPVLSDSLELGAGDQADGAVTAGAEAPVPDAIAERPDVRAADMEVRAARKSRAAVGASLLPSLELAGDYGLSGRKLNSRAEWTETLALQLNWNLWDGGKRGAQRGEAEERVRQADLKAREIRAAAAEESRSARSAMQAARQVALFASERMRFAEEEESLARQRFESGGSGNLEVISAQASVSLAHQAYYDALYGYNRARLEYLKASHRLSAL